MQILGIAGSLRVGSHNRRLLDSAQAELPAEANLEIFSGLGAIPAFNEDVAAPLSVVELRSAVAAADAVLIATPEYNASIPGVLKNALDWASRPYPDCAFRDKPIAVMGASTGMFGAVWAQAEVRKVLDAMGAQVVDRDLPVGMADQAFTPAGRVADAGVRGALEELVRDLLAAAVGQKVMLGSSTAGSG